MNDAFWGGFFSACLFIGALVMLRVLLGTYGESRYREGWNDHVLRAVRKEGEHKGVGVQAAPGAQRGRGSGDDRTTSRNSDGHIPASPDTGKTPDVKDGA